LLGIVGSDSSDDGCERMKGAEREKRGSEASASFESNRMEYATFSYMVFFFFLFVGFFWIFIYECFVFGVGTPRWRRGVKKWW